MRQTKVRWISLHLIVYLLLNAGGGPCTNEPMIFQNTNLPNVYIKRNNEMKFIESNRATIVRC